MSLKLLKTLINRGTLESHEVSFFEVLNSIRIKFQKLHKLQGSKFYRIQSLKVEFELHFIQIMFLASKHY